MSQQHRPLTGMQFPGPIGPNGATPPLLVPPGAAAAVIHQIDASVPVNFLDQVTLFLLNTGAAPQSIEVVVAGTLITVAVPAGEIMRVFDEQPLFGVSGDAVASRITVRNVTAQPENVFVFGYFTR